MLTNGASLGKTEAAAVGQISHIEGLDGRYIDVLLLYYSSGQIQVTKANVRSGNWIFQP
jgi:hypothetical protein